MGTPSPCPPRLAYDLSAPSTHPQLLDELPHAAPHVGLKHCAVLQLAADAMPGTRVQPADVKRQPGGQGARVVGLHVLAKLAVDVQQHGFESRQERPKHIQQRNIVRKLLVAIARQETPLEGDAVRGTAGADGAFDISDTARLGGQWPGAGEVGIARAMLAACKGCTKEEGCKSKPQSESSDTR